MNDGALSAARVADSRQAALLLDVSLRKVLTLLMKRARSSSELARELGLSLQRAHYLIGKLHAADVAHLDSVQPRSGRAVKRYRAAPRWFVPFEVTGADTLETFLGDQILPRMQHFVGLSVRQIEAEYSEWGFWLEQDGETSSLNVGNSDGTARELFEGDKPFMFSLGTLWLSPEHASRLKRRLLEVLDEFSELHDLSQPPYTIGLQLARGEVF